MRPQIVPFSNAGGSSTRSVDGSMYASFISSCKHSAKFQSAATAGNDNRGAMSGIIAHGCKSGTRTPVEKPFDPCNPEIGPTAPARFNASLRRRPDRPDPNTSRGSRLPHASKKSRNCLRICCSNATCSSLVVRRNDARGTGFPPTAEKLDTPKLKLTYRSSSESPISGIGIQGNSPRRGGGTSLVPRLFAAEKQGLHAGGSSTEPHAHGRRESQPRK